MPTTIGRPEVRKLLDDGAQLVEVLPGREYEAEPRPGASSIPPRELERPTTAQPGQSPPASVQ